jgi:hypothetical protein
MSTKRWQVWEDEHGVPFVQPAGELPPHNGCEAVTCPLVREETALAVAADLAEAHFMETDAQLHAAEQLVEVRRQDRARADEQYLELRTRLRELRAEERL